MWTALQGSPVALLASEFVVGFTIYQVFEHCNNLLADQAHDFIRPVRYGRGSVCPLIVKLPFLSTDTFFFSRDPAPSSQLPPWSLT